MKNNNHIVKKIAFHLEIDKEVNLSEIRNNLVHLCHTTLKEEMESIMDRFVGEKEIIRIDRLELNLGSVKKEGIQKALIQSLEKQLLLETNANTVSSSNVYKIKEKLDFAQQHEKKGLKTSTSIRKLDAFLYFLNTGTFSWWSPIKNMQDLANFISEMLDTENEKKETITIIKNLLNKNQSIVNRLVQLFDESEIFKIIKLWTPFNFNILYKAYEFITTLTFQENNLYPIQSAKQIQAVFISAIVKIAIIESKSKITYTQLIKQFFKEIKANNLSFLSETINAEQKKKKQLKESFIRDYLKNNPTKEIGEYTSFLKRFWEIAKNNLAKNNPKVIESIQKKSEEKIQEIEKTQEIKEDDSISIIAAGIILAWPLLSTLFKERKLLENNLFKNQQAQYKALQFLNYISFGHEKAKEFEMLLNKILVGLPIDSILPFSQPLTEDEKIDANELLSHLIKTWTILKNTSIEGLRETFLIRKAELSENEEGYLLKVEQKGMDILMDKMPWGFRMIKLAWMDKIMYVEW